MGNLATTAVLADDPPAEVLPRLCLRDEVQVEPARPRHALMVQYTGQHATQVLKRLMGEFPTASQPPGKVRRLIKEAGGFTILVQDGMATLLDRRGQRF